MEILLFLFIHLGFWSMCVFMIVLVETTLLISSWNLVTLTLNRYIAVTNPTLCKYTTLCSYSAGREVCAQPCWSGYYRLFWTVSSTLNHNQVQQKIQIFQTLIVGNFLRNWRLWKSDCNGKAMRSLHTCVLQFICHVYPSNVHNICISNYIPNSTERRSALNLSVR